MSFTQILWFWRRLFVTRGLCRPRTFTLRLFECEAGQRGSNSPADVNKCFVRSALAVHLPFPPHCIQTVNVCLIWHSDRKSMSVVVEVWAAVGQTCVYVCVFRLFHGPALWLFMVLFLSASLTSMKRWRHAELFLMVLDFLSGLTEGCNSFSFHFVVNKFF